jgi:uncharacterized UPF0146 family protein
MRRKLDFYETDEMLTRHLLQRVNIRGKVIEPTAGPGAMARVLVAHGCQVITNDIDPQHPTDTHEDATDPFAPMWNPYVQPDWVVANPPFTVAHDILPLAYSAAKIGVAFLLRLSYLEPCANRGAWLDAHASNMTDLIIFGQPRPSFTGDGRTDNVTTAWMVWKKPGRYVTAEYDDCGTRVHFVPNWKERFHD